MIASSLLCPPNNITDVIYNLETLATRGPLIVRQPVTVDTNTSRCYTCTHAYAHILTHVETRYCAVIVSDYHRTV